MTMSTACGAQSDHDTLSGPGVAARGLTVRVDGKGQREQQLYEPEKKFTVEEDSARER